MISEAEKRRRKRTKRERNQRLVDLYNTGNYSLKELVNRPEFDISRQRAHQIIKRAGVDGKAIQKARVRKNQVKITCEGCGVEFHVKPSQKDRRFHDQECYHNTRRRSEEELLRHLRDLYDEHGKITTSLISKEAPPSYTTIRKRFGRIAEIRALVLGEGNA